MGFQLLRRNPHLLFQIRVFAYLRSSSFNSEGCDALFVVCSAAYL